MFEWTRVVQIHVVQGSTEILKYGNKNKNKDVTNSRKQKKCKQKTKDYCLHFFYKAFKTNCLFNSLNKIL